MCILYLLHVLVCVQLFNRISHICGTSSPPPLQSGIPSQNLDIGIQLPRGHLNPVHLGSSESKLLCLPKINSLE